MNLIQEFKVRLALRKFYKRLPISFPYKVYDWYLLEDLFKTLTCVKNFPDTILLRDDKCRHSYVQMLCTDKFIIHLKTKDMHPHALLHEIAHIVAWTPGDWHGKKFCGTWLRFAKNYSEVEGKYLEDCFKKFKVEYEFGMSDLIRKEGL